MGAHIDDAQHTAIVRGVSWPLGGQRHGDGPARQRFAGDRWARRRRRHHRAPRVPPRPRLRIDREKLARRRRRRQAHRAGGAEHGPLTRRSRSPFPRVAYHRSTLAPLLEESRRSDTAALLGDDRKLVRESADGSLRFLLLKPDDVPTYVEYGTADLERERTRYAARARLRSLSAARPRRRALPHGRGRARRRQDPDLRASPPSFRASPPEHFASKGVQAEIIYVQGSVELRAAGRALGPDRRPGRVRRDAARERLGGARDASARSRACSWRTLRSTSSGTPRSPRSSSACVRP